MLDGLKALLYHRPKARRWCRFRRHMFLLMVSTLESKQTHSVLRPLRGANVSSLWVLLPVSNWQTGSFPVHTALRFLFYL